MSSPASKDSKPRNDPGLDETLQSSAARDEIHDGGAAELGEQAGPNDKEKSPLSIDQTAVYAAAPEGFFVIPTTQDGTALGRALSAFTDALVAPRNNDSSSSSLNSEIPLSEPAGGAQPRHEDFHVQFTWPELLGGRPRLSSATDSSAPDDWVPLVLAGHGRLEGTVFLRTLADSLHRKYERTNDLSDLERAISTTVDAIQATDPSHSAWPALETAYRARYRLWSERTGKMPDAEVRSMQFEAKGVSWLPPELTPNMGLFVPVMVWTGDLPVTED